MTTGAMGRSERPSLSRDAIVATALRLTDEQGLAGLSMRKLGAELGVEAMSLYHYVDSKDDLLDAVLDRLYGEIDLPRHLPDEAWEKAVREGMQAFHDVLVKHRAALELITTRPARSESSLEVVYWAYRRFEVLGLPPADAIRAFRFAVSYVMGHAVNEVGVLSLRPQFDRLDPDTLRDPALRELFVHMHKMEADELYQAGVDQVIAGLKATFDLP